MLKLKKKNCKIGGIIDECSICFEQKELYSIFNCEHSFCLCCLTRNLLGIYTDTLNNRNIRTCPLCRTNVNIEKFNNFQNTICQKINRNNQIQPTNSFFITNGTTIFDSIRRVCNRNPLIISNSINIIKGLSFSFLMIISTSIVKVLIKDYIEYLNTPQFPEQINKNILHMIFSSLMGFYIWTDILIPSISLKKELKLIDYKKTAYNISVIFFMFEALNIIRLIFNISNENQINFINSLFKNIWSQRGGFVNTSLKVNSEITLNTKKNNMKKKNNIDDNNIIIINDNNYKQLLKNINEFKNEYTKNDDLFMLISVEIFEKKSSKSITNNTVKNQSRL